MDSNFYKAALYGGMSGAAFKLATVLGMGWFWFRPRGCCVLYAVDNPAKPESARLLAVADPDAENVTVPGFIEHNPAERCHYLVSRINGAGCREHTSNGLVRIDIGADGLPVPAGPSGMAVITIEPAGADSVLLSWFYIPMRSAQMPEHFDIFWDGGSGVMDYSSPIGQVGYTGRKVYRYKAAAGSNLKCRFDVRAVAGTGQHDPARLQAGFHRAQRLPECATIIQATTV